MEQVADIMTKPLKLETFCNLRDKLGECMLVLWLGSWRANERGLVRARQSRLGLAWPAVAWLA
ncbi:hypothetical protein L195_g056835, partial [Trifolium pratense]